MGKMKKLIIFLWISLSVNVLIADEMIENRALKAAALSLLLPGGGQAYNGEYIKAGAALGTEAAFLSLALYNYSQSEKYYDEYKQQGLESDLVKYNDYYNKRQNYFFWLGASVFVFTIDAFVDAHLKDYLDTKEKIHLKFENQAILLSVKF